MAKKIPESEMIGKKFGKLTVTSKGEKRKSGQYWLCRCDCGNEKEVRGDHLRSGHIKRCSHCTKIEIGPKTSIYKPMTDNDLFSIQMIMRLFLLIAGPLIKMGIQWHTQKLEQLCSIVC